MIGGGMRHGKVAEALGVDRWTVWSWMQKPAFRAETVRVMDEVATAARDHFRANLLRASEVDSEGMEAMKPLYLKDGEGFAPVEDVPDHAIRLKAAHDILDRAGIPRRTETITNDPFTEMLSQVAEVIRERKKA